MDYFDDLFVVNMDIRDGSGNLILYAGVRYYKSNWGVQRGSKSNIVEGSNMCFEFLSLYLLEVWKKKQFEKTLMRQWSGVNSLLNGSKEGKNLLNLLSMLTTGPLIFSCCLRVRLFSDSWWEMVLDDELVSRRNLKMWLLGRE